MVPLVIIKDPSKRCAVLLEKIFGHSKTINLVEAN